MKFTGNRYLLPAVCLFGLLLLSAPLTLADQHADSGIVKCTCLEDGRCVCGSCDCSNPDQAAASEDCKHCLGECDCPDGHQVHDHDCHQKAEAEKKEIKLGGCGCGGSH